MKKVVELEYESLERLKELIRERSLLIDYDRGFQLASGRRSYYLFDLKPILLNPEGANLIARYLYEKIKDDNAMYVGGLESGAIPIVTALCMFSWDKDKPLFGFFVRKKPKKSGTQSKIEGNIEPGENVIIVDDVTTTGGSVLKAIEEVEKLGCKVIKVISVIDRLEGARENLSRRGIKFDPLFTKRDFGLR